ncbi:cytosine deaminase [Nodosilinea sp. LEGE 07088]|uniref:cytosine deaminase n=1 Tax=Nodosilinea sp. LEGE 07088 TaxID=2777968 RepID=UPI00187F14FD|nr:cytosine deaminase [Nodosilinea sp. LEGE 07088]MBE9138120.1 cytosine deaminase [Nodosilinea sp. LEGE 07088]
MRSTALLPGLTAAHSHYWLQNVRLPLAGLDASVPRPAPISALSAPPLAEPLVAAHIEVRDGQIAAVVSAHQPLVSTQPVWDLRQSLVWPCFVDCHTHLDKGQTWLRSPNPDGTFGAALAAALADQRHWSAEDLYPRMAFGLRCSYAHGTQAVRTHLDCADGKADISFAVFDRLRREWAGRLTLQAVCLVAMEDYERPGVEALADTVARYGGLLGGVIYPQPGLAAQIDRAFALAEARGLDLDFHADESLDPAAEGLRIVAETKLRRGFQGRVNCGHCCSLSVQSSDRISSTLALVKAAGVSVVSLPLCNLYLQDRQPGHTPRYRGVTLLTELQRAGVAVALASDNCRDAFFAYGDHDMVEVFTQSVRIGHLDRPIGDWPRAVTQTPAQIMGLAVGQIGVGRPADLVVFKARSFSELLSRPQSDRCVIRHGTPIDTTLPDYAELDAVVGVR